MIPVKVAISGQPGTGKTTTVLRIAQMLEDKFTIGGFTTHPIVEEGETVGYNLKNFITGEEELSASVRWDVKPRLPGKTPESTPLGYYLDKIFLAMELSTVYCRYQIDVYFHYFGIDKK